MNPKTKKRKTDVLAEGCYADAHGVTVLARLGSRKNGTWREARDRFPLVDAGGVPYSRKNNSELVIRRAQLLEDLRAGRIGDAAAPGTLGFAIDTWKEKFPIGPGDKGRKREDDHYLLAHWRKSPIASMPVTQIRRRDITPILDEWIAAGRAPSSVNSRKRVLGDILRIELDKDRAKRRALNRDDDDVIVPTDLIPNVPPREQETRGVDFAILQMIQAELSDKGSAAKGEKRGASKTKIRIAVMMWSGLSHISLVRLERSAVNFNKSRVTYPARSKGKGSPAITVDALPPLMDALRAYHAAGLWGKTFSRSSMRKAWKGAVDRTREKLRLKAEGPNATAAARTLYEQFQVSVPKNCRPYDIRHSFLSEVTKRFDERAAQALGQHKDRRTTQRYTKAAVPQVVSNAIAAMRAVWSPAAGESAPANLQIVKGESTAVNE